MDIPRIRVGNDLTIIARLFDKNGQQKSWGNIKILKSSIFSIKYGIPVNCCEVVYMDPGKMFYKVKYHAALTQYVGPHRVELLCEEDGKVFVLSSMLCEFVLTSSEVTTTQTERTIDFKR